MAFTAVLVTIFACSAANAAEENCGVSTAADLMASAAERVQTFVSAESFDRWSFIRSEPQTIKFDLRNADQDLADAETFAWKQWREVLRDSPAMSLVSEILSELESSKAFRNRLHYIPSTFFAVLPGCEAMCALTGRQFLVFVNPDFVKQFMSDLGGGDRARRGLRFLLAHELAHAVFRYHQIVTGEPVAGSSEILKRQHLIVDAIGLQISGVSLREGAEFMAQVSHTSHRMFNLEGDSGFRARCLESLSSGF